MYKFISVHHSTTVHEWIYNTLESKCILPSCLNASPLMMFGTFLEASIDSKQCLERV